VNTRTTYTAGQYRCQNFCQTINSTPIPTSKQMLLLFSTHLPTSSITHSTIKVYMLAIGHMLITEGCHHHLTPRVQLAFKGTYSEESGNLSCSKDPFTHNLRNPAITNGLLNEEPHSYYSKQIYQTHPFRCWADGRVMLNRLTSRLPHKNSVAHFSEYVTTQYKQNAKVNS